MAFDTNLILDVDKLGFIRSLAEPSLVDPPVWYADDLKHLRVQFVRRASSNSVEVISAAGVTMQVAIGAPAASPPVDTSATAGVADANHIFPVDLPLNVTPIQTALGSNLQVARTLEFRTTDGVTPQRYSTAVVIKQRLITGTLSDVAPPAVAISSAEAQAIFVPRDGSNAAYPLAYFIVLDEEDSTKKYKVSLRAGQWHVEPLQ